MNFLTEEHIRARNVGNGGTLVLNKGERLTPSASEYAKTLRITIQDNNVGENPGSCGEGVACSATSCNPAQELTYIEDGVQVPKNHPAVTMRGKLDTLLSQLVLVQTQFDPKDRRPAFLKQCLQDLHSWVMLTLQGEVTGQSVCPAGMGGMDVPTLYTISREPKKYLGIDHLVAQGDMGGNVALLNWLRASVREVEVVAVSCSRNMDVLCALNRLSSAVYVLMLLTFAAEQGIDLASVRKA